MDTSTDTLDETPVPGDDEVSGIDDVLPIPADVIVDDDLMIHVRGDDDAPRPGDDLDPDDAP